MQPTDAGNSKSTIPHQYSQSKRSGFPVGSSDTAAEDGRRGSNVYEVNQWLSLQFGRCVASHAWVVCQLKRLATGRRLRIRSGSCAELRLRLAGVARQRIRPDGKLCVVVKLY